MELDGVNVSIEKSLAKSLKRAYNLMHVEVKKFFKKLEINIIQFDLMENILLSKEKMLTIQELASRTLSLQPNITKSITELEKAGFIERSSGEDRRIVMIKVTPKGENLVDKIQTYLQEFNSFQFQNLTNAEKHMLDELLKKISQLPDRHFRFL
jgi:DNA-binding MarR family transcriptional regulator